MLGIARSKLSKIPEWKFVAMMTMMIFSWALAFPFIKIGLNDLSPVNLTVMRFFVVCIVLIVLLTLQPKKFSKLKRKDVPTIFTLGFFGVMVYHLGLNYGEQYISPGAASLIIATIPLFVVVLAAIFLNEKITSKKLVGIFIAFSGVIIISIWGKQNASIEIKYISGAFAVLLAAIMGALYTVAGKRMLKKYSALSLTVYAMLLGSLGLLPFINNSIITEVTNMPILSWIAIIFLGVCSTVIGYTLWYMALEIKDVTNVSIYLYCIPIVTITIDFLMFKEGITLLFILGGVLIIMGVIMTSLKGKGCKKKI
ncbi:DMT(drug/metabolite transporter) superfamily permease [Thermoplasmatales archaeon SCGC AB-539-N05]|nr:DMT(drug/metabolite transporter) superfamily permease [Thermoplasmatales archaeon SCGC AB-539-N05]